MHFFGDEATLLGTLLSKAAACQIWTTLNYLPTGMHSQDCKQHDIS